jgi:hypothetical protein
LNIRNAILKEHSKQNTLTIINYIGSNPDRFKQLIDVFLAGPYRITQRASWPLSYSVQNNPTLIKPHLNSVLNLLKAEPVHDAAKRNIVRLLQFVELPRKQYGKVWTTCVSLMDKKQPVAIRVFSMTVLGNIAQQEPGLKNELRLLIEEQLPYASAGYLSRARKVLKELEK